MSLGNAVGGRYVSFKICDKSCGSWYSSTKFFTNAGYFFVAMDPIGTGVSDHRLRASFYNDYEETLYIISVVDSLGWTEPFLLIGHSGDSNISCMTAGVFTDRI